MRSRRAVRSRGGRGEQQRAEGAVESGGKQVEHGSAGVAVSQSGCSAHLGQPHGFNLVTHGSDSWSIRPDELNPFSFAFLRELRILRQESISRVHCLRPHGSTRVRTLRGREGAAPCDVCCEPEGYLGASLLACFDNTVTQQVRFARVGRPYADCLVSVAHMHGLLVLQPWNGEVNGHGHVEVASTEPAGEVASVPALSKLLLFSSPFAVPS